MSKIGLFICHCGSNIAGTLNIPEIMQYFRQRDDVEIIDDKYLCSDAGLNALAEELAEKDIDRVVIGSCSFKLHGELFQRNVERAGINRFLVAFANIREQNSWVHHDEPVEATRKAITQIEMAIEQVKLAQPLETQVAPVKQSTLVIGAGISGIMASLSLANAGYPVTLVEKSPTIGGLMALFDKTFPTLDCSICILGPLMVDVKEHPNITLLTNAEVTRVDGYVGDFTATIHQTPRYVDEDKCVGCFDICAGVCPVTVRDPFFPRKAIDVPFPQAVPLIPTILEDACVGCKACEVACDREAIDFEQRPKDIQVNIGTIIVATGAAVFDPTLMSELGYTRYKDVISAFEFERMLTPDGPTEGKIIRPSTGGPAKRIAFVLCVGSRNEEINRPWCSRVCCMYSIKQAFLIKDRVPDAEVFINFTDIRAFGKGCEEFYNRARAEKKVRFNRLQVSEVRMDDDSGMLEFIGENTLSGEIFEEMVDLVVLAVGMEPQKDTPKLASILNIATGPDGFYLESHLKLRPSEASIKGVFLAGCCQGPKDIPDSVAQSEAAAVKAIELMAKGEIELDPRKVQVDLEKCDGCRLCAEICSFKAITIKDRKAHVELPVCTGCGACVAMCHTGALSIPGFTKDMIYAQVDKALLPKKQEPLILAFLCNWCSYAGADLAGTSKIQYPSNVRVVHVMCTAMINPDYVFRAFARGADGVLVAGCYPQDCHYATGFEKAFTRMDSVYEILDELGVEETRFRVESVSAGEGRKFAEIIQEFTNTLKKLGSRRSS